MDPDDYYTTKTRNLFQAHGHPSPPQAATHGHGPVFARSRGTARPAHGRSSMPPPFSHSPPSNDTLDEDRETTPILPANRFQIFPQSSHGSRDAASRAPSRLGNEVSRQARLRNESVQPDLDSNNELLSLGRQLQEANRVKAQLEEERHTSAALRESLATSQNSENALRIRVTTLESDVRQQTSQNEKFKQKVSDLKERALYDAQQHQDMDNRLSESNAAAEKLRQELQVARTKISEAEQRLEKVKDHCRRGLDTLGQKYSEMSTSFDRMKELSNLAEDRVQQAKDDVESLRVASRQHLKRIDSCMDEQGHYLHRSAETRDLVLELQTERNNTQQVVDILRAKLESLGSELIEARKRVVDLELSQREDAVRWDKRTEKLQATGKLVEEGLAAITEKLVKREAEYYEMVAETVTVSAHARESDERANTLQAEVGTKTRELASTQKRLSDLEAAMDKAVEDKTQQLNSKVTTLEAKAHKAEVQLSSATERINSLNERNRTLLASRAEEARSEVGRLEKELEDLKYTHTTDAAKYAQTDAAFVALKKEYAEIRAATQGHLDTINVLKDRFDSQGMTLRLEKEQLAETHELLHARDKENAIRQQKTDQQCLDLRSQLERAEELLKVKESAIAELEAASVVEGTSRAAQLTQMVANEAALKAELSTLRFELQSQTAGMDTMTKQLTAMHDATANTFREQNSALQRQLEEIQAEAKALQKEVVTLKLELVRKEESLKRRVDEEAALAKDAKTKFLEAKAAADELRKRFDSTLKDSDALREQLKIIKSDAERDRKDRDAAESAAKLAHARLDELKNQDESLDARYQENTMTPAEKAFVQTLLTNTQAMYEQELVNKENDLKSKAKQVLDLKDELSRLETACAKSLKQQHGETGFLNMLDPKSDDRKSPPKVVNSKPESRNRKQETHLPRQQLQLADSISDDSDDHNEDADDPIEVMRTQSLGKRERPASPDEYDEPPRAVRKPVSDFVVMRARFDCQSQRPSGARKVADTTTKTPTVTTTTRTKAKRR
ncbi:hypothetical protein CYLTODRAFT_475172 [Cylindrobasidium torrendii FP15055 ss-10]|uniref:Uncharacterized protein n=1 Tax=Cylindrobasidium torrendii FP15055 ss-10 TaxID=1314674 RepID=A0A0D7AW25_9AGAR|nr:hypothetical protein CYLTODRAFT_475172 [Cylindrobasidium torrendii FP15055 ss-10]